MLEVLHPLDAGLLGPGEVIYDDGASQELGSPHVLLNPELLLPLPVTRNPGKLNCSVQNESFIINKLMTLP